MSPSDNSEADSPPRPPPCDNETMLERIRAAYGLCNRWSPTSINYHDINLTPLDEVVIYFKDIIPESHTRVYVRVREDFNMALSEFAAVDRTDETRFARATSDMRDALTMLSFTIVGIFSRPSP